MKSPSFAKTIRLELFSFSTFFGTILFAVVYLFAFELLLNYRLLVESIANHFPFSTILGLSFSLFIGAFTSMSSDVNVFILLLFNAVLIGLNLTLLLKTVHQMRSQVPHGILGKAHVSIGGAALFSIVTTGCASCGLSLLSILGLSATLSFLPFHGAELRVLSLILLLLSAFYMLKKLHEAKYCKI